MYLVNFELFKSLKLTNGHLMLEISRETLIWGPPYDATINVNNVLPH
jgi:hypothetical protein